MEKPRLSSEDPLPLIADVSLDLAVQPNAPGGGIFSGLAGRGSYIADFGVLDIPGIGALRARAGLRYSQLYPRGGLELAVRKELRDEDKGYELFLGARTVGDDRRLDFVADVGALRHFLGARAFYRFLWGRGAPFEGTSTATRWNEMGSSLGVTQTQMPPRRRGELTVGWRTGLFDAGLESVMHPSAAAKAAREAGQNLLRRRLLNSTPYAAYGIDVDVPGFSSGHVALAVLPEHGLLQYALRLLGPRDSGGGSASVSVELEQSLRRPVHTRLRVGTSYLRG